MPAHVLLLGCGWFLPQPPRWASLPPASRPVRRRPRSLLSCRGLFPCGNVMRPGYFYPPSLMSENCGGVKNISTLCSLSRGEWRLLSSVTRMETPVPSVLQPCHTARPPSVLGLSRSHIWALLVFHPRTLVFCSQFSSPRLSFGLILYSFGLLWTWLNDELLRVHT